MILGLQHRLDEQAAIIAGGLALLAEGKLQVLIDSPLKPDEIMTAHTWLDASGMMAKIVISIVD